MKTPSTIAIIPARGGSKGIPRKNIAPLLGKPLLYYTLREAYKAKRLDYIIVSTDDTEIAEVARSLGGNVPFLRPKELAEDTTPDLPVFQHALTWLKEHEGWEPDIVLNLRPTAPLRLAADIDSAIELMVQTGCDSVRTVSRPSHNPFKMWYVESSHKPMQPLLPTEHFEQLGTDVPRNLLPQNIFWQNAMIDGTRARWIVQGKMYGPDIRALPIEDERAVDIDTPHDLARAEVLMQQLNLCDER